MPLKTNIRIVFSDMLCITHNTRALFTHFIIKIIDNCYYNNNYFNYFNYQSDFNEEDNINIFFIKYININIVNVIINC